MLKRTAGAVWEGSLKDGNGTMNVGSGALDGPYTFASRFADGKLTNPEELLGAAHAGCFFHGALARFGEGRVCTTTYQHDRDGAPGY